MLTMWSVRMRAEGNKDLHISGAEGLYEEEDVEDALRRYLLRARTHPRGKPERITLTVERLKIKPKETGTPPLRTLSCGSPREADSLIRGALESLGVSGRAATAGLKVVRGVRTMRGAALIGIKSGRRLEPDRKRGVRATRMGLAKPVLSSLKRRLSRAGLNTPAVREALVLASKVALAPGVVAELCISDDPGYTTGYIASRRLGYLRIPNIKKKGSREGGRAIFLRESGSVEKTIRYLEEAPVLVTAVSRVTGRTVDPLSLPGLKRAPRRRSP
jgi:6-carboxyhexanoate--CoA ligase